MFWVYVGYFIVFCLFIFVMFVFKKDTYGFYITIGEFWSGKTQNTTAYLKQANRKNQVNITNYYTGYTDYQMSSHTDLVNILNDIYSYHEFINLLPHIQKLHTHKKTHLKHYFARLLWFAKANMGDQYFLMILEFLKRFAGSGIFDYEEAFTKLPELVEDLKKAGFFSIMKPDIKFNIVIDEGSIYFNPRNFAKNFAGDNEKLLDFIYQPRKLNLLMFVVVQSPMELDVKFRRLATFYRKYYKGIGFYRWYRDFYFMDPENIDLEKAEEIGWGILYGANINLYPVYPNFDYNTKELIRPGDDIYERGALFSRIKEMTLLFPKK